MKNKLLTSLLLGLSLVGCTPHTVPDESDAAVACDVALEDYLGSFQGMHIDHTSTSTSTVQSSQGHWTCVRTVEFHRPSGSYTTQNYWVRIKDLRISSDGSTHWNLDGVIQ